MTGYFDVGKFTDGQFTADINTPIDVRRIRFAACDEVTAFERAGVFEEVRMSRRFRRKEDTVRTGAVVAENAFLRRGAQQRLRETARERLFPNAGRSGKQIGVRELSALDRVYSATWPESGFGKSSSRTSDGAGVPQR